MTLRSIELYGFKSFAAKTVLEFAGPVTAVVGPNGSGKSNVIDALRWCLGEREAKQLRGETLENLIFAGTPKRAAVSVAKVCLIFDNSERIFALDSPEVVLERRIDRSGESQFLLNGEEIKLKELLPILARARLGTRGLTMIGQGQSDLFIRSTPAERRLMIEEVLGLREYRLKKTQAERRLVSSDANIEKLRAMLEELEPHMRFLKRQAGRYEKRTEVEVQLRKLEDEYFSIRFKELEKEEGASKEPKFRLMKEKERLELLVAEKDKIVSSLDVRSESHDQVEQVRQLRRGVLAEQIETERELARAETRLEVHRAEPKVRTRTAVEFSDFLTKLREGIKQTLLVSDFSEVKKVMEGWYHEIQTFFAKEERTKPPEDPELLKIVEEQRHKLGQFKVRLTGLDSEEERLLRDSEVERQSFRAAISEREFLKNQLRDVERQLQELAFSVERIALKRNELSEQWRTFGRSESDMAKLSLIDFSALTLPLDAVSKMNRLRGELAVIGEIDEKTLIEARETEQRHELLSKELADLSAAKTNLIQLITELDQRIHVDFKKSFSHINEEFAKYFGLMFGGGRAQMRLKTKEVKTEVTAEGAVEDSAALFSGEKVSSDKEEQAGIEIELSLPRKRITSLEMLSGGEKSLVSLAALFALISVSPPPFLVLDEIDAPLDETNARRFAELISDFSRKTQFIMITHNRVSMEAADLLYGVTMGDDGASKIFSLRLEEVASKLS